jgi:hypothetical protein
MYWLDNTWCPSQESASLIINGEIRAFCFFFLRKEPQGTRLAQTYQGTVGHFDVAGKVPITDKAQKAQWPG